jgi:hypothetical protein
MIFFMILSPLGKWFANAAKDGILGRGIQANCGPIMMFSLKNRATEKVQ